MFVYDFYIRFINYKARLNAFKSNRAPVLKQSMGFEESFKFVPQTDQLINLLTSLI